MKCLGTRRHRAILGQRCLCLNPNCLNYLSCNVTYSFKIGDYGIARSLYPGDYLSCDLSTTLGFTSSVMSFPHRASFLPLRWMAPEALEELHQNRSPVEALW